MTYDQLPKDITDAEAVLIIKRFATTCGWEMLDKKYRDAISALPDIEPVSNCNTMIQIMVCDAVSDLRGEPHRTDII